MIRDHHLSVLGLNSRASKAEVTQSYHDLCKVWHPDRFAHDERLQKVAETKMKEINGAYEFLKNDHWLRDDSNGTTHQKGQEEKRYEFSSEAIPSWNEYFPTGPQCFNLFCIAIIAGSVIATFRLSRTAEEPEIQKIILAPMPHKKASEETIVLEPTVATETVTADEEIQHLLAAEQPVEASLAEILPANLDVSAADIESTMKHSAEIPGNLKQRDKLLVLVKNQKVTEAIINQTPELVDASITCNEPLARHLLDRGGDPNQTDLRGDSALIWAVKRRCLAITKLLLDRGADLHRTSANGFTPYAWSRVYGSSEIGALLARRGADTKSGSYWWRNSSDERQAWLDRSLADVCRNKNCR